MDILKAARQITDTSFKKPEALELSDGTPVRIRPIRPDDAPRLQALAPRLSNESIFRRFLTQRRVLLDDEAHSLTNVDYQSRMALVATNGHGENVIAVARYTRLRAEPEAAEAAIIVEDSYQGKGLATLLLARLVAYARAHGIRAFIASIHVNNEPILQLIQRSGLPIESQKLDSGMWEIRLSLQDTSLDR